MLQLQLPYKKLFEYKYNYCLSKVIKLQLQITTYTSNLITHKTADHSDDAAPMPRASCCVWWANYLQLSTVSGVL